MTQPVAPEARRDESIAKFAAASALGLTFRRMRDTDQPFLERLYASIRQRSQLLYFALMTLRWHFGIGFWFKPTQ